MNKMREIAAMYGLRLGERFKIKGKSDVTYYFAEDGLAKVDGAFGKYYYSTELVDILNGCTEIEYLPWKPQDGDIYFYVDKYGGVCEAEFDIERPMDLLQYKFHNCFKTVKEAKAAAKELRTAYNGIREELTR